jgi:molybdopterin synthase catalytic subunit
MYRLSREAIDLGEIVAAVRDPAAGAIATFLGVTRNHNHGREVTLLEYEAYPEMAEREMERIATEAVGRWPTCKIAMVHRVGAVPVGETSVAIAVSAGHRPEAFAACRFAIDRLKEIVPIWKKEHFVGGEVWIGQCCADHAADVADVSRFNDHVGHGERRCG